MCGQQRLDAGTQTPPFRLRQIEMTAVVKHGHLADLLAGTEGGDEAVGKIGLAGRFISGSGATDEYPPDAGPGVGIPSRGHSIILSLDDGFWTLAKSFTGDFQDHRAKWVPECQRWVRGNFCHK